MPFSPRHLLLNLLLAEDAPLEAQDAIRACSLFGLRENTVRVALVRLVATGMIEAEGRGRYRLGPNASGLAEDVRTWRTAESRVRDWRGGWLAVHCGGLGRTDRTALRRRERALHLLGFRELDRDLFVRPDNLSGGVGEVRRRLDVLGLEPEASVFVATDFDPERESRARSLWRDEKRAYRKWRTRLEGWLARRSRLDLKVAAREAFVLGHEAIRHWIYDPLLPAPMADVEERKAFVASVIAFDRAGHEIWRQLRARSRTERAA